MRHKPHEIITYMLQQRNPRRAILPNVRIISILSFERFVSASFPLCLCLFLFQKVTRCFRLGMHNVRVYYWYQMTDLDSAWGMGGRECFVWICFIHHHLEEDRTWPKTAISHRARLLALGMRLLLFIVFVTPNEVVQRFSQVIRYHGKRHRRPQKYRPDWERHRW